MAVTFLVSIFFLQNPFLVPRHQRTSGWEIEVSAFNGKFTPRVFLDHKIRELEGVFGIIYSIPTCRYRTPWDAAEVKPCEFQSSSMVFNFKHSFYTDVSRHTWWSRRKIKTHFKVRPNKYFKELYPWVEHTQLWPKLFEGLNTSTALCWQEGLINTDLVPLHRCENRLREGKGFGQGHTVSISNWLQARTPWSNRLFCSPAATPHLSVPRPQKAPLSSWLDVFLEREQTSLSW